MWCGSIPWLMNKYNQLKQCRERGEAPVPNEIDIAISYLKRKGRRQAQQSEGRACIQEAHLDACDDVV